MKKLLISIIMLSLLILSFGCGGGGGGGDGTNPCDGPVPCLNSSWGYIDSTGYWNGNFAVFISDESSPVESFVVLSDGINVCIAWSFESSILVTAGSVINCYNANLDEGGWDYEPDGVINRMLNSMSAKLEICNKNLKIYDIVIEETSYSSESATFYELIHTDELIKGLSVNSFTNKGLSDKNIEEIEIKMMLVEQLYIKEF